MQDMMEDRQYRVIQAMRFPLIVLVVLAHSVGDDPSPMRWPADGAMVYHFVSEMLSHHLASIGVCCFFVFSGFLFFRNAPREGMHLSWYGKKWKRRCKTLLVPYLLWNTLNILAILLVVKVSALAGVVVNAEGADKLALGPLYWFVTGPADYPLWFIRDLMILCLMTPLFFVGARRVPWLTLLLLIACYLPLFPLPLISFRSLFFFGIGAWLGLRNVNLLSLARRVRVPAAVGAVVLLVVATMATGRPAHEWLRRLFFPCGVITAINLCDGLLDKGHFEKRMLHLSSAVFFIFAAHEIYILGWTKGLLLRLFGESLAAVWARYLLVPLVVLLVCLLLYRILNKLMPRTLAFACGGRTTGK